MSTTPESTSRIEELLKELISKVENSSGGGGEITITIDDKLSSSSTNPVQNNVITAELGKKVDTSAISKVATSGSYADLENKPEIPPAIDTSSFALQDAIAEEYDSNKEYRDGDLFMYNGSLYCVDSKGEYIKSENLITAEVYDPSNGYISGQAPSNVTNADAFATHANYNTLGYIEVIPGATYEFVPSGVYPFFNKVATSHALYSEKGRRISIIGIGSIIGSSAPTDTPQIFTIPSGAYYIRLGAGPDSTQPNRQFYRLYTSMPKVRKIDALQFTQDIFGRLNNVIEYNPLNHNGLFRGKDLTDVYTIEEIYEMVHDGSFKDLYLGDYFNVTITTTFPDETEVTETAALMIAGFDYYYNVGDTALTKHHIVLIPRTRFKTTARMNETNTTEGGYLNCNMHQKVLPCYAESLRPALNGHLLTYRDYLSNKVTTTAASMAGAGFTGSASGGEWTDVTLALPNEVQIYGTTVFSSSAYDVMTDNRQLPVFKFIGPQRYSRDTFWLRAVVSNTQFAYCAHSSSAYFGSAEYKTNVRPLILFG